MKKIWQEDGAETQLDPLVEEFTVDEDRELDLELLPYDIEGSSAHASCLLAAGIISQKEHTQILTAMEEIREEWERGALEIPSGIEDCHSLIEIKLIEKIGEAGEKIHAGRSRNDQVLTALRLLQISRFKQLVTDLDELVAAFDIAQEKWTGIEMPGYSHGRRGMVIKVSDWLGCYYHMFAEDQHLVMAAIRHLDRSPLGSGAGFGNILGLDRKLGARELGFSRVQSNPLACMGSRGKDELLCLHVLSQIGVTASKFAADLLLFTSENYGFFSLPDELLTGSSMMPNKRNYDLLEIARANGAALSGYCAEVATLIHGLPSGFHRDFQLAKRPLFAGFKRVSDTVEILTLAVRKLRAHPEAMAAAIDDKVRMTEEVMRLVVNGMPFRKAYHVIRKQFAGKTEH